MELEPDGDVAHRLLWGAAVDQALADETGAGDVYWYLTDHLGTVRDVVDYVAGGATIVNHIAYDSFGRRTGESNSALNDFDLGFTGKWLDRATGLQWNLNRWYNPAIQRWMSADPIGFAAGDANLNRYVGNEPTGWVDPLGLHGQQGGGESDESWYERRQKLIRTAHIAIWTDRKLPDAVMKELDRIFSEIVNNYSDPEKYRIVDTQLAVSDSKEWLKEKGLIGLMEAGDQL